MLFVKSRLPTFTSFGNNGGEGRSKQNCPLYLNFFFFPIELKIRYTQERFNSEAFSFLFFFSDYFVRSCEMKKNLSFKHLQSLIQQPSIVTFMCVWKIFVKWIKKNKNFFQERYVKSMTWLAKILELYPIENLWWKFFFNGPWEDSIQQRSKNC